MKVGPTDGGGEVDMGPVITAQHRDKVASYLDIAAQEGADVALDGRKRDLPNDGFLLGPSVVDHVQPGMRLAKEEIFGPVLSVVRADDLDEALAIGRDCEYGNGACIFTAQRLRRPAVQAPLQRRHDRHQRRRAGPDGLVPVHRLEQIVLRRPAHPGHRRHSVLHAAKDDDDPLVRKRGGRHRRPGLEDQGAAEREATHLQQVRRAWSARLIGTARVSLAVILAAGRGLCFVRLLVDVRRRLTDRRWENRCVQDRQEIAQERHDRAIFRTAFSIAAHFADGVNLVQSRGV